LQCPARVEFRRRNDEQGLRNIDAHEQDIAKGALP
jgi:hypothetical protein